MEAVKIGPRLEPRSHVNIKEKQTVSTGEKRTRNTIIENILNLNSKCSDAIELNYFKMQVMLQC